MARLHRTIIVPAVALSVLAASASGEAATTPGDKFGDWRLVTSDETGSRLCFVMSEPKDSQPAGANRDKVLFYVSAWPKDGVQAEVSVRLGYPVKRPGDGAITVGTASFKMQLREDKGFVLDPTQELKLIEAMKKGSRMQVQAVSERGTATTDTYSLSGLAQALQALAASCP